MIEVTSLSRRYGKITVVDDVSFAIGANEIVGLLGHNGAGKTTIMRMLSGYLEPSAGNIRIDGAELAANAHNMQQQLGYLPENLPVYPDMMVADYLDYTAALKGINKADRLQAIREVVAATELGERILDPISTLSRGLKQRVGVAQAILGRPRLLILDEPTNGLDPYQAEHMRVLIKQLARRATVILSTHIMQEVEAVCDRVLVLRHGKLALDQTLEDLHYSNALRLRTDTGVARLAAHLEQLPQIDRVEPQAQGAIGNTASYTLYLQEDCDFDTAAHTIAQRVLSTGARLYQMEPLSRDLDSVFREVNADGA